MPHSAWPRHAKRLRHARRGDNVGSPAHPSSVRREASPRPFSFPCEFTGESAILTFLKENDMQISLLPQSEQIVKERMRTGQYSTPEAVVADALALLDRRPPDWTAADLRRGLEQGLKDLDEGRYLEFDEPQLRRFIDELKSRALKAGPGAAER